MKIANCKNCGKEFQYKYTRRGNSCSQECTIAIVSKSKLKYNEVQINQVILLKKEGKTNKDIVSLSNVKLSKVKEIIKENRLFLSPKERQKHAYDAKLAKNPNAMENMRSVYHDKASSEESLENVKKILNDNGYEYVSGFTKKSQPFSVKCHKCGNIKEISKINTIVKNSCMYCSGSTRTSSEEIEIKEWIESLGIKVEKYKFKEREGGIEIDIYMPEFKIGIEYCGIYWHNENSPTPRTQNYHFNKMKKANRDGIRLITIFNDEWKERKDQIKGFLLSVLNKNTVNIYGRKTVVKEVTKGIAQSFLEENHIQGSGRIKIAFALFYQEQIIGIVTGNNHHRQGQESSLVLNRLAFKTNCNVVGGSSKLLKSLIDYAKQNQYKEVISWSDNRWSEGNVYEKINFSLEEELKPDYSYVVRAKRISKQSCQKKNLLELGAIGNTEKEMAESLGYSRIWDCGKKRWKLDLI